MSEVATIIPPQLVAILERPPLCVGEDRVQYIQLRELLMDEIKPTTMTEYLLAYDIIAAEWELLRLLGFKAGMINAHMLAALKDHRLGWKSNDNDQLPAVLKLFRSTLVGNSEARKKLEGRLEKKQLTLNDVAAAAYESHILAQSQTDHMINATLQRREAAYAELERRKRNGRSLSSIDAAKRIAAPVIDGESSTIAPDSSDIASNTDSSSIAPVGSDRNDPVHAP
ncbi:MAG TPA: hypothetical protein VGF53_02655 [Pseudolabrys sp.]|jgi:hypothetical protein